jgi:uncharacterized protein
MDENVLERLVSSYLATRQPLYSFAWQGGEPTLMGVGFFRRVVELQKAFSRPGMKTANALQTNATLVDKELADLLAEYRFLVGVSIDGPAEVHDTYRRSARGEPTHADVIAAIERMSSAGVSMNALVLVSKANIRRGREVYHYLRDLGVQYQQYIPCVEFDRSGCLRDFAITGEEWGAFLLEIFDEWHLKDTRTISIRHHDALVSFFLSGERGQCTMGGRCDSYYVVEKNGDVYPCDFYVEPELRLGNIMRDSWGSITRNPVGQSFAARKSDWHELCDDCPHLSYCSGDCTRNRRQGAPEASWLCAGWRAFYDVAAPALKALARDLQVSRGLKEPLWSPETWDPDAQCYCGSGKRARNCHLRGMNHSRTADTTRSRSTS